MTVIGLQMPEANPVEGSIKRLSRFFLDIRRCPFIHHGKKKQHDGRDQSSNQPTNLKD